jgi:hypothetical protein
VELRLVNPEARLGRPRRAAELRALAGGQRDAAFPHHLGLTVSRVTWRAEITLRAQGEEARAVCAIPALVRLDLVHAEHVIRLARELPAGGCLAGEVLAHERRHAAVNRRSLEEAAAALRRTTRDWAGRATVRAADTPAAAAALQADLARTVAPVLDRLARARATGHAAIDTPAEYRRLSRVCPEDQRRLRAALARG